MIERELLHNETRQALDCVKEAIDRCGVLGMSRVAGAYPFLEQKDHLGVIAERLEKLIERLEPESVA